MYVFNMSDPIAQLVKVHKHWFPVSDVAYWANLLIWHIILTQNKIDRELFSKCLYLVQGLVAVKEGEKKQQKKSTSVQTFR